MEKRSVASLALFVAGAAVLVAVVVLAVQVRSSAKAPKVVSDGGPQAEPGERAEPADRVAAAAPESPPEQERPPPKLSAPLRGGASPLNPLARGAARRAAEAASPPVAPAVELTREVQGTAFEASDYYGRGEYDNARQLATEVLGRRPDQHTAERMLRIAASSSCFMGDADQARIYYDQLTPAGKSDIEKRCARVGIEFH